MHQLALVVPERPSALRSGPATILPLGFRGEAVFLAFLIAQPVAKLHSVIPTDADHWMIVGLGKTRIQPVRISIQCPSPIRGKTISAPFLLGLRLVSLCLHELPKLPHGDLGLPHVTRLRDLDLM